jgi:hypothetical protein
VGEGGFRRAVKRDMEERRDRFCPIDPVDPVDPIGEADAGATTPRSANPESDRG